MEEITVKDMRERKIGCCFTSCALDAMFCCVAAQRQKKVSVWKVENEK